LPGSARRPKPRWRNWVSTTSRCATWRDAPASLPPRAYTYFTSKEHLITEVFWRRLTSQPGGEYRRDADVTERVGATLQTLSLLVADAPRLASACTAALLTNSTEVRGMRDRIGLEWRRRLQAALGEDGDQLTLTTLEYVISGALVHAGDGRHGLFGAPGPLERNGTPHLLADRLRLSRDTDETNESEVHTWGTRAP
jgi:hypothetical protein